MLNFLIWHNYDIIKFLRGGEGGKTEFSRLRNDVIFGWPLWNDHVHVWIHNCHLFYIHYVLDFVAKPGKLNYYHEQVQFDCVYFICNWFKTLIFKQLYKIRFIKCFILQENYVGKNIGSSIIVIDLTSLLLYLFIICIKTSAIACHCCLFQPVNYIYNFNYMYNFDT